MLLSAYVKQSDLGHCGQVHIRKIRYAPSYNQKRARGPPTVGLLTKTYSESIVLFILMTARTGYQRGIRQCQQTLQILWSPR
ncbi:protein of unknown function [Hyphomicrobium sp. MC1]|nr:protein of unknown function [Hyphomicrobium sp. MC1]